MVRASGVIVQLALPRANEVIEQPRLPRRSAALLHLLASEAGTFLPSAALEKFVSCQGWSGRAECVTGR